MKKTLIFGAFLAIGLIASDDCSRETKSFFEFNKENKNCVFKKEIANLLNQLDVQAGLMQSFSEDVKQFLCEEPNTEGLKELILNQFKTQNPIYYKEHQNSLETYTVDSLIKPGRTKENIECPPGFEITGKPCRWKCTKEIKLNPCPPSTTIYGKKYKLDYNATSGMCDGTEVIN